MAEDSDACYVKSLLEENEILKAILQRGATLTVAIGEKEKKQLLVRNLLLDNTISEESKETKYQQDGSCNPKSTSTVLTEVTSSSSSNHHSTAEQGQLESDTSVPQLGQDERPQFYKKDFICILEEKNQWKEKADQLQEELEEWKCAALEAQEKVESLEAEINEVQQRIGGHYYPNEIQADVLGLMPKGPNFRPQPLAEVAELYVTDVEVSGCVQKENKFLFAIELSWSDKRRFEIYRRYGEFFTLQHTLLLLYPDEAGRKKSAERVIPALPTADNVLAIFGATNSKSTVESRLQLINNYCHTILLRLPKKISRSPLLFDFFKARPFDKQLESLKRPLHHSLELSVYPLIPEGKSRGLYVAIANYDATNDKSNVDKLSLQARETVRVMKEDDSGWWYVQNIETGECGFVPSSFIKKVGDPSIPEASIDTEVLGFVTSIVSPDTDHLRPQDDSDAINTDLKYRAVCDYETSDVRQLSFLEGAMVIVIDKSEDGWWFGTLEGREGWIPSTYLEPLLSDQQQECQEGGGEGGGGGNNNEEENETEGQDYITNCNYTAKDEDEISLPSGVKVGVLEKSFTGWWKIKYRGRTGYAPATVLRIVSPLASPDEEMFSPVHSLLHSLSGIKKPPPRRKHVIKKRAQTLIAPIEENDEPTVLTATTICDEEVRTRRTSSIKGFLRRGTADLKLRTKKPVENQTGQSHSVSKVTAMNNEQRNDALAKLSLQLIDK